MSAADRRGGGGGTPEQAERDDDQCRRIDEASRGGGPAARDDQQQPIGRRDRAPSCNAAAASAAADAAEDAAAATDCAPSHPPSCFVIVYNVAKRHNVGNLLRSCTAFGVKAACLVGSREYNGFGAHGAAEHVALRHYPTLEACVDDLRANEGARVVGVEIDARATPVHTHAAFQGPTAFMLGNEGDGLNARQRALCDGGLVYIPQHGPGTASLNVTIAASIVLHQFAVWARYPERPREGQKYVVAPRPTRTHARGVVPGSLPPRPDEGERRRAKEEGEAWLAEQTCLAGGLDAALGL